MGCFSKYTEGLQRAQLNGKVIMSTDRVRISKVTNTTNLKVLFRKRTKKTTKISSLNDTFPLCSDQKTYLFIIHHATAVTQWLRCATNRKVAGSKKKIPVGVGGFFTDIKSIRSHYGPGVDSGSNRNEYQEHFLGVKAAGAFG